VLRQVAKTNKNDHNDQERWLFHPWHIVNLWILLRILEVFLPMHRSAQQSKIA
jgi:hypothetical protein